MTKEVTDIVEEGGLIVASEMNRELSNDLSLGERFGFIESPSGLFIPAHARKVIPAHFANLITRASRDKAELLTLSPRAFEEFVAGLFDAMGYTVELTKTSRGRFHRRG